MIHFFQNAHRAAGTPNVKVGVVGAGTASVFQNEMDPSKRSLNVAFTPSKGMEKHACNDCSNFISAFCSQHALPL